MTEVPGSGFVFFPRTESSVEILDPDPFCPERLAPTPRKILCSPLACFVFTFVAPGIDVYHALNKQKHIGYDADQFEQVLRGVTATCKKLAKLYNGRTLDKVLC